MDNKAQWSKLTSARISETSQQDTLSSLWKLSLKLSIYVQSHDFKVTGRIVGAALLRMVRLVIK